MNNNMKKSLIIALVGEPNAGKSTLLNRILKEKISIVTPKVQTTRKNIRGVFHKDDVELIFIDTPGIFKPSRLLERSITRAAWRGIEEADCVCLLVDAKQTIIDENQQAIIQGIRKRDKPIYVIINKIDNVNKPVLLKLAEHIHDQGIVSEIFMISGLKGQGIEEMLSFFTRIAPDRSWLFSEDDLTDTPISEIAEEMTREKLFKRLNRELPYSLKVETESWQEMPDGSLKIYQSVVVMRESQKKIVIGENAEVIKAVNQASRLAISRITGQKVHLFLHVKVKENWIENEVKL